ncbi:hypothetical protein [Noviherbaspirillum sp. UKPF54]|uniref:hypothetical protein n=1 Tax=Noviherbaspirillum sp. UKPF54 TaxID=2601898 RepID=UPI0011B18B5B|nr:hypothetical protein [Noviherbaspirillum sp. UKPF54]QDZ29258.1 hypothetical protein FAY22_15570 [Noviherbaspirillum sp. UKPF54]
MRQVKQSAWSASRHAACTGKGCPTNSFHGLPPAGWIAYCELLSPPRAGLDSVPGLVMPGVLVDDPLVPGMLPEVPELESLGAVVPVPLG